jgi:hypothetical protein
MSDQIRQAIDVLKRDKKKLGLIIGLLAVGLLLWGRLMLKQVPRTATAKPSAAVTAADEARRELADLPSRRLVRIDLPETLSRDPFQVDPTVFPKVEKPVVIETQAKSAAQAADVKQDAAALVRQAATGLALQTTILGDAPRALINGQLLAPGDKIRGFELKKVMPREVILEMSGVELKLEM